MTLEHIASRASALARLWATSAAGAAGADRRAARQLAKLVADPAGLDLAVNIVDRVARPEDPRAAARALRGLDLSAATFLGPLDRALLSAGRSLAPYLPRVVVPAARRRLRALVGHLVVSADDESLTRHIAAMLQSGYRLNLNLLGEAVLGEREAQHRTAAIMELLRRPDVDYVSVKTSSLVSQISPWDLPGTSARVVQRLRPLLEQAQASTPHKFINLDMEEYRDLALTVEVFEQLLSEPDFMHLSMGIAVQAYLPDSLEAMHRLIDFATRRCEAGGAPIKIRLVKGANLAMERVEAELRGWAQAPYPAKAEVDANYVRLIDLALRPEAAYAVRLGVASHNLFHLAYAHLLATDRGVQAALDVEMLHGMAPGEAAAIQAEVANPIVLYTPVVAAADFDVAIAYLVRRLEEAATGENYLHDRATGSLDRQERAFLAAVDHSPPATPRRSSTRAPAGAEFANTTDSDPALAQVREFARRALAVEPPELRIRELASAAEVDEVVAAAAHEQQAWGSAAAAERAGVLRTIAGELERRRSELLTVMAHEAGKTVAEADPEISEAIDFARYYAAQAEQLEELAAAEGLRFTPDPVVLVTPPWNFPVAILLGGVLAALAAGSAAIVKPAPQTPTCAQVAMGAVHAGLTAHGHSPDLAQIVAAPEGEIGQRLVAHANVDTVLLTGAFATASLFTSWRVDRPRGPRVLAETSGKNALIVTPSADVDLAVADVVRSAFGHAGQKCSAASLLILVGSAARSGRLRRQLQDAVESLRVDWPGNLSATVGPLLAEPSAKLTGALTVLDDGEQWLVEPRPLDDTGRLWRPGVKEGVRPGSAFHHTEYFGPVLGVMAAPTLREAIEWQNAVEFGLTGGIHSLDEGEVAEWLDSVEVGNAYINRHITGAIVRRQPFGGWKNSSVGPGAKAGGPNYLAQLGTWEQVASPGPAGELGPRVQQLLAVTSSWVSERERAWLASAARSDAAARDFYRYPRDPSGLRAESNVLRYRPVPRVTIRAGEASSLSEVLRMSAAALAAGVPVGISVSPHILDQLPAEIRTAWEALQAPADTAADTAADTPAEVPAGEAPEQGRPGPALDGIPTGVDLSASPAAIVAGWRAETLPEFTMRAATWADPGRIRVLDADEIAPICAAVSTSVTVLGGPPLISGRREVLGFLREQAVSRTVHRFGHLPDPGNTPAGPSVGDEQGVTPHEPKE